MSYMRPGLYEAPSWTAPQTANSKAREFSANSFSRPQAVGITPRPVGPSDVSNGFVARPPSGRQAGGEKETAIIQFTSLMLVVEEDEGTAKVDVMRLGDMSGQASCYYKTKDGSGKDGQRYVATDGELVFKRGERLKTIEVEIIHDSLWAATLEFKVDLSDPIGCELGNTLRTCRVKVIDIDTFPSSKYPEVGNGMEGIRQVFPMSLFLEYFKMNFQVKGLAWRTCLYLLLDQMKNAYLYYRLTAMAYMLNTLFHGVKENPDFTIDQRADQAILIGAGYILPMFALHAWDLARIQIDLSGLSRNFLQANIVRKYLNYNEASRDAVPVSDIQLAVREDAADVVQGYMAVLALLQLFVKLMVMMYFVLSENPDAIVFVIAMPCIMLLFGCIRNSRLRDASEMPDTLGSGVIAYLGDVASKYSLVADYNQRPQINEEFATRLSNFRIAELAPRTVMLNNDYFTKWLGPVLVGGYIMLQARDVLLGKVGHGDFVATLSVFSEISGDFSEGYSQFMKINSIAGTLRGLTELLNRQTDLKAIKKMITERKEGSRVARDKILKEQGEDGGYPDDLIPLTLQNVGFRFQNSGNNSWGLKGINLSVPQGCVVALKGRHGTGRQSLLSLIAHKNAPTEGRVMFPEHLRILNVALDIYILDSDPLHNLTFGVGGRGDRQQALYILNLLGASKNLIQLVEAWEDFLEHEDVLSGSDYSDDGDESCSYLTGFCTVDDPPPDPPDGSWVRQVSASDKAKLSLARAFIVNPQVMVLQRPLIHFNASDRKRVMEVLAEHVKNRGLGLPAEKVHKRRPRTVFLSVESDSQALMADVIWELQKRPEDDLFTAKEVPKGTKQGLEGF